MTITHDKLNPLDAAMRDELLDRGLDALNRLQDLLPVVLRAAYELAEVNLDMSAVEHGLTDDQFDVALEGAIWGHLLDWSDFLAALLKDGPQHVAAQQPQRWADFVVRYVL